MRIGLLTCYLAIGNDTNSGLGRHYRWLADELVAQGHQVEIFHVCSPDKCDSVTAALKQSPQPWSHTFITARTPILVRWLLGRHWAALELFGRWWSALAARRVIRGVHKLRPLDIIETHSYDFPALFLLKDSRLPPVVTRVATTFSQMRELSQVRSRLLDWTARIENRAIVNSRTRVTHAIQHREVVSKLENIDPNSMEIVMLGLPDEGAVNPDPEGTRLEFLYVGRFESRKGIDVLLSAIPEVAAKFPHAEFTLVGNTDSSLWTDFCKAHPDLANGRVRSPGQVDDATLDRLYRQCTIFVAPSRYESFGLIYVEAMSRGKPVIGCHAGGIPEVVQDDVTGLLATPGDQSSLEICMTRLAADASMRKRMGEAGRQDFLDRFSVEVMAQRSVELYQRSVIATKSVAHES